MASTAISSIINTLFGFHFPLLVFTSPDTLKQGPSHPVSHSSTPYSVCVLSSPLSSACNEETALCFPLKRLSTSLQLYFSPFQILASTILIFLHTELQFCKQWGLSVWFIWKGRVYRHVCVCVVHPGMRGRHRDRGVLLYHSLPHSFETGWQAETCSNPLVSGPESWRSDTPAPMPGFGHGFWGFQGRSSRLHTKSSYLLSYLPSLVWIFVLAFKK